jgi:hypothetical protein
VKNSEKKKTKKNKKTNKQTNTATKNRQKTKTEMKQSGSTKSVIRNHRKPKGKVFRLIEDRLRDRVTFPVLRPRAPRSRPGLDSQGT